MKSKWIILFLLFFIKPSHGSFCVGENFTKKLDQFVSVQTKASRWILEKKIGVQDFIRNRTPDWNLLDYVRTKEWNQSAFDTYVKKYGDAMLNGEVDKLPLHPKSPEEQFALFEARARAYQKLDDRLPEDPLFYNLFGRKKERFDRLSLYRKAKQVYQYKRHQLFLQSEEGRLWARSKKNQYEQMDLDPVSSEILEYDLLKVVTLEDMKNVFERQLQAKPTGFFDSILKQTRNVKFSFQKWSAHRKAAKYVGMQALSVLGFKKILPFLPKEIQAHEFVTQNKVIVDAFEKGMKITPDMPGYKKLQMTKKFNQALVITRRAMAAYIFYQIVINFEDLMEGAKTGVEFMASAPGWIKTLLSFYFPSAPGIPQEDSTPILDILMEGWLESFEEGTPSQVEIDQMNKEFTQQYEDGMWDEMIVDELILQWETKHPNHTEQELSRAYEQFQKEVEAKKHKELFFGRSDH